MALGLKATGPPLRPHRRTDPIMDHGPAVSTQHLILKLFFQACKKKKPLQDSRIDQANFNKYITIEIYYHRVRGRWLSATQAPSTQSPKDYGSVFSNRVVSPMLISLLILCLLKEIDGNSLFIDARFKSRVNSFCVYLIITSGLDTKYQPDSYIFIIRLSCLFCL